MPVKWETISLAFLFDRKEMVVCFKKRQGESDSDAAERQKAWDKDCLRFFKRIQTADTSADQLVAARIMFDQKDRAGLRQLTKDLHVTVRSQFLRSM